MEDKRQSKAKKKDSKARCLVSRDFDTPEQVADAILLFVEYAMKRKSKPRGMHFIRKGKTRSGKDVPVIEKLGGKK